MNSIEGINFETFQRIDLMAAARIFRCQGYCWLFRFVFPALVGVPNLADVGVEHTTSAKWECPKHQRG